MLTWRGFHSKKETEIGKVVPCHDVIMWTVLLLQMTFSQEPISRHESALTWPLQNQAPVSSLWKSRTKSMLANEEFLTRLEIGLWLWCHLMRCHVENSGVSLHRFSLYIVLLRRNPMSFNTLMPRQNGRHFADDIFIRTFFNENIRISIRISLEFVPMGPIKNIPALVAGAKPLSEPMMVSSLTLICVSQPERVNVTPA